MPKPGRDLAYVWDIVDAAHSIVQFVGERSFQEYIGDPMLQAAVERKIEIIGEAARRLTQGFKDDHPEIPWPRIISQRNVLAHDYGRINHTILWRVVTVSIPELVQVLQPLIPPLPDEAQED